MNDNTQDPAMTPAAATPAPMGGEASANPLGVGVPTGAPAQDDSTMGGVGGVTPTPTPMVTPEPMQPTPQSGVGSATEVPAPEVPVVEGDQNSGTGGSTI